MEGAKASYPEETTFGTRIRDMAEGKRRVAKYVVKKFLLGGGSVFISDGSSTFYVGLELLHHSMVLKKEGKIVRSKIFTNNLAVAHEYALWNTPVGELGDVKAYCAGGDINSDLMMVSGEQTREIAAKVAKDGPYLVLAVRAIFGKEGPAGLEKDGDVKIKVAALQAGMGIVEGVIFIADHTKLSSRYSSGIPLLYARDTGYWDELMSKKTTYIVSTKHPDIDPIMSHVSSTPKDSKDWYLLNRQILQASMKKRFIEV